MTRRYRLAREDGHALLALVRDPATPPRVLQRARIVYLAAQGRSAPAIAREVGMSSASVRVWLTRFTETGVAGLHDLQRPGARPVYDAAACATIYAAARTAPASLGVPASAWTLDLLCAYLRAEHKLMIGRSRLHDLLRAARISWRAPSPEPVPAQTLPSAAPGGGRARSAHCRRPCTALAEDRPLSATPVASRPCSDLPS